MSKSNYQAKWFPLTLALCLLVSSWAHGQANPANTIRPTSVAGTAAATSTGITTAPGLGVQPVAQTPQPMWTDVAQAVGTVGALLVAVLGFAVIIRQLRQVEATLKKDALETLYERAFAIQNILLQDPGLRAYFYDGAPAPTDKDVHSRLETFCEVVFDFYELILDETGYMPDEMCQTWKAYLLDLYGRSPVLREHLERNPKWYSDAVKKHFMLKNSE